ncbi:MAG: hypothetical protein LBI45_00585 [Bacteroidales bacterium]|jgi:hypothetical protein|nr:hypothetical protein [Bacteroidales bacterium]
MAQKVIFSNLGYSPKDKIINIILIIIIVIALFFGVRYLWRNQIQPLLKKESLQNEVAKEISQGNPLSYEKSKYQNFADTLYRAMKGAGCDTSAVYFVFNQMRNKTDVLQLIASFGTRDGEDLSSWMNGEWFLSISKINNILANKGIDFTF